MSRPDTVTTEAGMENEKEAMNGSYASGVNAATVVANIDWCDKGVAKQHSWDEFNRCRSCGGWLPDSNTQFAQRLESLINHHSQENASNTPDFILAKFMTGCLALWNRTVQQRETWYGRDARPSAVPFTENPPAVDAVDRQAADLGTPSTREEKASS